MDAAYLAAAIYRLHPAATGSHGCGCAIYKHACSKRDFCAIVC